MNKNNKDIFESKVQQFSSEGNFFLTDSSSGIDSVPMNVTEPTRRLNDYDFNLLKEDAYKDVTDDLFKLEYKISRIENEIKSIDAQIISAQEIQDINLLNELIESKHLLENDYDSLIKIYNERSLSAKISDRIWNCFGNSFKSKVQIFQKYLASLSETLISKMPQNLTSAIELKKSLVKLENLNKSVDELMGMNIPYGENYNKYEQLSKYIIKANSIQSEITKYMKDK